MRPDEFTVTSTQTEVEPNTLVESQPFTVTGINREAKVTLSSDEIADLKFTVNGGEPKESGSTVRNGDEVVILGTSPAAYGANASIDVNIGGVESEFAVSTGDDETPPEVSILFPPPSTMTEGETVFVRGTMEDLYGEVSTLLVNGVEVDITDGLPEWSVNVPVNVGENTLTVTATDVSGNENNDHSVNVRRDPDGGAFPDNENPTESVGYSGDFSLLESTDLYIVPDYYKLQIFSVDLRTGVRQVVSQNAEDDPNPFGGLWYLTLSESSEIFTSDAEKVFKVNMMSGDKEVIISSTEDIVQSPRGLAYVVIDEQQRLYVSDQNRIYWLDIKDGGTTSFISGSGENEEQGVAEFSSIRSLAISEDQQVLYFLTEYGIYGANIRTGAVEEVVYDEEGFRSHDLDVLQTGAMVLADPTSTDPAIWKIEEGGDVARAFSSNSIPTVENPLVTPSGVDCRDDLGYCIIVDPGANSLFAMDRSTGHRVVLTRSVQE